MLYDNSGLISNVVSAYTLTIGSDYRILGLAQIGMGVISVCDYCLTTRTSEYDIYFDKKLWELKYADVFFDDEDLFNQMGIGILQGNSSSESPRNFKGSIMLAKRNLVRLDNCVIYDLPVSEKFFPLP